MSKKKVLNLNKITVQNLEPLSKKKSQAVNGGANPDTIWAKTCGNTCGLPWSIFCPTDPYCPTSEVEDRCFF